MAGTDGMDAQMAAIVNRIVAESGGRIWIVSGFRSREQQEALYQKYLNGTGNLAAKPGSSMHEHGTAVDFGGDLQLAASLASKYGLTRSVPGEPWHFTLGGERPSAGDTIGGQAVATAAPTSSYNPAAGGLPPNASPEQIEAYIRENYPQAAGFLDVPEIRAKLIEAARGQWTGTKLQAEIQATTWWRTNGEAARQYFALKGTDPAQLKALVDAKVAELEPQLAQLGITKGLNGAPADVQAFAEEVIKYGWSPDEVRARLASLLQHTSEREGLTQGSAPDITADELMRIARTEFFVPISRMDAERWAVDIYAGRKTEEALRDYLANMAEARFPGIKEQGFTPGDYMAPIRNIIADTLEMAPESVDLLDRRWAEVLQYQGPDGKLRPMSLAEAERYARSRPEYQQTKGAKAEAASMAETLAKTFGAV